MSHSNYKSFCPKNLDRVDLMRQTQPGFTWPKTPRGSTSPRRLWTENPYVTPSTNRYPCTPTKEAQKKSADTSNKENQDPRGHFFSSRAACSQHGKNFSENQKTSRVLQELDINSQPFTNKVENLTTSGL